MSLEPHLSPDPPLCVDLDHTLLKIDLLYESVFLLLKRSPFSFLSVPFWILKGRSYLKRRVAEQIVFEVAHLPYRKDLVEHLRAEQQRGRRLVLVTAADELIAQKIQEHLQIFSQVIASNGLVNMKGAAKAEQLQRRFGKSQFDYAGDSRADLEVWRWARRAIVVSNSERFIATVNALSPVEKVFPKGNGQLRAIIRASRPHQWAKNLLVFVPVVTAHRLRDVKALFDGSIAFLSFCLIASCVYLLNDILDLQSDRAHWLKCSRGLASGQLSILTAVALSAVLLSGAIALGLLSGLTFIAILAIYLCSNIAYSLWWKRVVMLDVVVLACFYALRLLAGGAATKIAISDWLLAFAVFFFFCLAIVKRYSELRGQITLQLPEAAGRGYRQGDLDAIGTFGVASGMIAVLIIILYVMSPDVRVLYQHPTLLLLLCPLFLYWITRLWVKTRRGEMPQDPLTFALTDRVSYLTGLLAAAVLYLAAI